MGGLAEDTQGSGRKPRSGRRGRPPCHPRDGTVAKADMVCREIGTLALLFSSQSCSQLPERAPLHRQGDAWWTTRCGPAASNEALRPVDSALLREPGNGAARVRKASPMFLRCTALGWGSRPRGGLERKRWRDAFQRATGVDGISELAAHALIRRRCLERIVEPRTCEGGSPLFWGHSDSWRGKFGRKCACPPLSTRRCPRRR